MNVKVIKCDILMAEIKRGMPDQIANRVHFTSDTLNESSARHTREIVVLL